MSLPINRVISLPGVCTKTGLSVKRGVTSSGLSIYLKLKKCLEVIFLLEFNLFIQCFNDTFNSIITGYVIKLRTISLSWVNLSVDEDIFDDIRDISTNLNKK